jgi:hypothetical protein
VRAVLAALAVLWIAAPGAARGEALDPAPDGVDARALAARAESNLRSERTFFRAKMTARSSRFSRSHELEFQAFLDRSRSRAFIRIVAPPKEQGRGFLLLHPNLWTYSPGDDRIELIPRKRLREPWMESHFTNDDLLRGSSEVDDYDHRLIGVDPRPSGSPSLPAYVIESLPSSEGPTFWARLVTWIAVEAGTPLRRQYFDAEGQLVRVLDFSDVREVQGRHFPHVWTLRPRGAKGSSTRVEVESIRFDAEFEETVFTTQHLRSSE